MTFAAELKALFEKYDVKFDITNEYTVEFFAGSDLANRVHIAADTESETWDRAADRMTTYKKEVPNSRPAYYDAEGGSMCNGLGRDYF